MKYTDEQLNKMTLPASDSEEDRMDNATRRVKGALRYNSIIDESNIEIFAQGSYANNTNIRNNSDVDINVCYTGCFYYDIPSGTRKEDYGLYLPSDYHFPDFKNDVERVLVNAFGRDHVKRKNKCLHISGYSNNVDIDVVPTMLYRKYIYPLNSQYIEGVKLLSDNGESVINYPIQHLANGRKHNLDTKERYKKLVRIVKRIHLNMENEGFYHNPNITSFLLECMVCLLPNSVYCLDYDSYSWNTILKSALIHWHNGTAFSFSNWITWLEVSQQLKLMYGHKWSYEDVNDFVNKMWIYLGY